MGGSGCKQGIDRFLVGRPWWSDIFLPVWGVNVTKMGGLSPSFISIASRTLSFGFIIRCFSCFSGFVGIRGQVPLFKDTSQKDS